MNFQAPRRGGAGGRVSSGAAGGDRSASGPAASMEPTQWVRAPRLAAEQEAPELLQGSIAGGRFHDVRCRREGTADTRSPAAASDAAAMEGRGGMLPRGPDPHSDTAEPLQGRTSRFMRPRKGHQARNPRSRREGPRRRAAVAIRVGPYLE